MTALASNLTAPLRALMLVLLLAGCSLPGATPESNEGGMGLPQQLDGETYPGDRRAISAEVEVADNGCAYLVVDGAALLAIWPRGSESSSRPVSRTAPS
ncbi:MAG: hypothetical protein KY392_06865 [Chloroflexi bacterium]|nr:hypothetical protein [Chloroflexota bacterium]